MEGMRDVDEVGREPSEGERKGTFSDAHVLHLKTMRKERQKREKGKEGKRTKSLRCFNPPPRSPHRRLVVSSENAGDAVENKMVSFVKKGGEEDQENALLLDARRTRFPISSAAPPRTLHSTHTARST